jgi:hypothetical protein
VTVRRISFTFRYRKIHQIYVSKLGSCTAMLIVAYSTRDVDPSDVYDIVYVSSSHEHLGSINVFNYIHNSVFPSWWALIMIYTLKICTQGTFGNLLGTSELITLGDVTWTVGKSGGNIHWETYRKFSRCINWKYGPNFRPGRSQCAVDLIESSEVRVVECVWVITGP